MCEIDESVSRPVLALGNHYPPDYELKEHHHRRSQFLYAASGVMAVRTPQGTWVSPPQRAVWIPGNTPHSVRMIGAVQTRSVLIEPDYSLNKGTGCQIISVSPLLQQLLIASSEISAEYDTTGRDGLVMSLLLTEICRAPTLPLSVPFPAHACLEKLCQDFLHNPDATITTDEWADHLGMNRRTFTRLFRRETGMSFVEWKQQACVSIALPRLAAGESVTSIALDMGYEGAGNFTAMFKRIVGAPPSRYNDQTDR